MLTKEQIKARLPERFGDIDIPSPSTTLDDANLFAAFYYCSWREAMRAVTAINAKIKQAESDAPDSRLPV